MGAVDFISSTLPCSVPCSASQKMKALVRIIKQFLKLADTQPIQAL
jgi:hypothetical protein